MTIGAIAGMSAVDPIPPDRIAASAANSVTQGVSAQPLPSGTHPPLSPAVLALLVGQQLSLYGSFNGG
ncbi:MAG TPA: hypothetical protein VGM32_21690 [Rhodopila sp.]